MRPERWEQSDAALVAAAQRGDRQALDDLVAEYLPLVYNVVGRALDARAHDVDDVVQETLLRAVGNLGSLRDPAAFRSWLVAIAIRQVRERQRSDWSRPPADPCGADGALDAPDPGADFIDLTILRLELSDQRRETALATRWLDADDRELLALWWLEAAGELGRVELVHALGLEAGHASVRVQRMRHQLETARAVVRALAAVPRCAELNEIARGWDGRPASVWRKRFARHVRECVVCGGMVTGLVPAERLLAGLALVPAPVAIAAGVVSRSGGAGSAARAAGHSASHPAGHSAGPAASHSAGHPSGHSGVLPSGHPTGRAARQHATGHARRSRWLAGHASAKAVAVAAGLAVAASAGIVYAATDNGKDKTAAAFSAPSASSPRTPLTQPTPAPTSSSSPSASPSPMPVSGLSALGKLALPTSLAYVTPGYNGMAEWTRVDTEAAPDGTLQVAWPAADGVHVTPLTATGQRRGADVVVSGAHEVGGLVAHNDGFALLTRVPDQNKWGDTAAALVRYRAGKPVFTTRLTGKASDDTAPILDSQLKWDGTRYGAYFVAHGAGGFADGHYGDKLVYVGATGAVLSGGWSWGCSHNEGIALYPEKSKPFTSLCFDDWRSGLFVSTGISAPDTAPVIQREQCWAGYCGGTFPGNAGAIVKSTSGRYATAFASRGAASAGKNPADSSGRGWSVTPKTATHQVVVAFLKNGSTPSGSPVALTNEPSVDHVNVRIAPLGADRLLVSWESVAGASCNAGTCTGRFTGTHVRIIDWTGKAIGPDQVVDARIAGDIAALPDGSLVWAYAAVTPGYSRPVSSSPTTRSLSIARFGV